MEDYEEALPGIYKRLSAMEKSHTYANTLIEDLRKDVAQVSRSCSRIEATFATYEEYLRDAVKNDAFYKKIRDEVIAGVAKSAVWAVIVGLGLALAYAVKTYLLDLLHGKA